MRVEGARYDVDADLRRTSLAEVSPGSARRVTDRLEALRPALASHFDRTLTGLQDLQFLVYREGDFFTAHRDRNPEEGAAAFSHARQISAVMFLNRQSETPGPDEYAGGSLAFYSLFDGPRGDSVALPLTAEEGLLIAFPTDLVHEVTPVESGERYTAVTWFV